MATNNTPKKKQIKDGSVVQVGPVQLDHGSAVPKNIQDVKQSEKNPLDFTRVNSIDGTGSDGDDVNVEVEPEPLPRLRPPSWMTIVSQTIRWTPDGVAFVDVVVEFEDIEAATGYDLRVSLHSPEDDYVEGI